MKFRDMLSPALSTYLVLRVLTLDAIGGPNDYNWWLLVIGALNVGLTVAYLMRRADARAATKAASKPASGGDR